VIATSKIVAMIGDTARFRAFLQLRAFIPQTFIRLFSVGLLTRKGPYGEPLVLKTRRPT
jgi:hypothetical protein